MLKIDAKLAICVDDLRIDRSGQPVLKGLDCHISTGTITGLIGPSGCGKTTLMRAIMGVQRITSGSISVLGETAGSPGLRKKVAYTSQFLSVYKELTVRENIHYFARLVDASAEDEKRVCDRVQLSEFADRQVRNLSGGQAGRVSLACALVGEPQVLVLDEPTVGLDPLTRNQLWVFFRELAESGTTILISSHVMDEATRCDNALIMREGRFLAHEPLTALMKRTNTHDPEEAFLALIEEDMK